MSKKINIALIAIIAVVLLMMAVVGTVIMSAVIAAFVFSSSSDTVDRPYTVGIIVKKTVDGNIHIQNMGGPDVTKLESITVSYQPSGAIDPILITDSDALDQLRHIGSSLTITADAGTPADPADDPVTPTHVIVMGNFVDGKSQVLCESDL